MKICLIGKYPPIEGGVSTKNYWLCRGLGQYGHKVFVVTNAFEVEDNYRIDLTTGKTGEYQPNGVHVFNSNPFDNPAYIPYSNPYVSKLASIATKLIKDFDIDIIYSHYFEPYAVAGFIAKSLTGKPLVVGHAGSDAHRLFHNNILHHLYVEILNASDLVLTPNSQTAAFFSQFGCNSDKFYTNLCYGLDSGVYSPHIDPIDWKSVIPKYDGEPVILTYGKLGHSKGTFDLLKLASKIKIEFKLVFVTSSTITPYISDMIKSFQIENSVCFTPFVFPSRIPEYIKASTVTCFLERDFPIKTHGSIIPREVMAVGKCFVTTDEIYGKQFFRDRLISGHNIIVVDPKNHEQAASIFERLLLDVKTTDMIGERGYQTFMISNNYEAFINSHLSAFELLIRH